MRRGEHVCYYLPDPFRPAVEATGASFRPYESETVADVSALPPRHAREAEVVLPQVLERIRADGPDVVVHDPFSAWTRIAADLLAAPTVLLHSIFAVNRHVDAAAIPGYRAQAEAKLRALREPLAEEDRALARVCERYGVAALDCAGVATSAAALNVVFFPRAFQPAGETFDERFVFVGPSVGPRDADEASPREAPDPDRGLLYISLGTVFSGRPEFFRACVRAFGDTGREVVVSLGGCLDPAAIGPVPANVRVYPYVPQARLLARAGAFITHAGMNSVMESLYFGVPMVAVPQGLLDQTLTAQRISELGLGVTLDEAELSAAALRAAVERVSRDPAVRRNVAEMRRSVRAAGGYRRAADAIEEYASRRAAASLTDVRGKTLQDRGAFDEALPFHAEAIALDPAFARAHYHLGHALLRLGRIEEALPPLRRALELDPRLKEACNAVGAAQREAGRLDAALGSYRAAVALDPGYADARCNLAIVLQERGDLDGAIAAYRAALDSAPEHAPAHGNLGAALRELGDLDGARRHLEHAVALDPRNGRFQRLLIELSDHGFSDAQTERIEDLVRAGGLETGNLIELRFALATAYARRGEAARAFEHLRAGNALKRSTLVYDEAETLRQLDMLPQLVGKPLLAALEGRGDISPLPTFVFGMPRSGTTLVEQVLAAHPSVHGGGELGAFQKAMAGFEPVAADPRDANGFAAALGERFRRVGARCASELQALAPGASRVTDKWPWSFRLVGMIRLALPNARLIHVRRDPVDTCFSCFATLFDDALPYMYDLSELGRYYRAYERATAYWSEILPRGAMLEVRYEDLVGDLEREARRLVAYCGLPWDPACLDFAGGRRPVRTASAVAVRRPLYRSAIGRAEAFRAYLGPLRAALGLDEDEPAGA